MASIACNYEAVPIDMLLNGQADFLEAGDCRFPGQAQALRARLSGDAERPIAIYQASSIPQNSGSELVSAEEAVARLIAHRNAIQADIGACARVFIVKLRKMSPF